MSARYALFGGMCVLATELLIEGGKVNGADDCGRIFPVDRCGREHTSPPTIGGVDIEGSLAHIIEAGSAWISEAGEVLAIARYSTAAGAKDYKLFDNPEMFASWAFALLPDANLIVVKDYEMNLRGPARSVAAAVPEEREVEWLIVAEGAGYEGRDESWSCWGTAEVQIYLADYDNEYVVVGRMPAWNPFVADHVPDTLSAIVPRPDGTVQRGIYYADSSADQLPTALIVTPDADLEGYFRKMAAAAPPPIALTTQNVIERPPASGNRHSALALPLLGHHSRRSIERELPERLD